LHIARNRRAKVLVDVTSVPNELKNQDVFYPVLGTWMGLEIGQEVALIVGLPSAVTRDQLKALGASAASTGAVALFHVLGVTPEAPNLEAVISQDGPVREITLDSGMVRTALRRLTTADTAEQIDAIAVGSPHFSIEEFEALLKLIRRRCMAIPFYACTARDTLRELEKRGGLHVLQDAGVEIVADTCVVVTPILPERGSVLMTNSGKFAHYGPSNTGYDVVYGSLEECVESAMTGSVVRTEGIWSW
jgi:predicted aconitase